MILRELTLKDEKAFNDMVDEWEESKGFNMLFGLVQGMRFESYLKVLSDMRDGVGLLKGFVPATALYAFEGDIIVGKVNLRHELNDHLLNVGGHIGYGVLSSHRGKGYATMMLKGALEHCQRLGISRVLVTCDEDNLASARVIEKNGGVFENFFDPKDGSSKKKRYWIQL